MKALIILFILFLVLPAAVFSQEIPRMTTEDGGTLEVTALEINSRIYGRLASTEMTITFFNSSSRTLAGDLYIPLPEGATVNGYALDIGGVMIDGVIVEKDKGRQVFEAIQRQGIDPGLIEKVQGNNFKTRVFPILANGSRTIRLSYVSPVYEFEGKPVYRLPLNFDSIISDFKLFIEVVKPEKKPNVIVSGIPGVKSVSVRDSFIIQSEVKNKKLNGIITVELPAVDQQKLLIERSADGWNYFTYFAEVPGASQVIKDPKVVTLYWDASGSISADVKQQGIDFLKVLFSRWENIKVELYVFRNEVDDKEKFTIKEGNADKLISYLTQIPYDGASKISNLPAPSRSSETAILISDGLDNYSESVWEADFRLHTIASAQGADYVRLKALAYRSGGKYINLQNITLHAAVNELMVITTVFSDYKVNKAAEVEIFFSSKVPVNGQIIFSGRYRDLIGVEFQFDGLDKTFVREISISENEVSSGEICRFQFAQQKLEYLQLMPDTKPVDIVELGREYGIVTPGTSLIVLESPEQYIEYRIVPPESKPEWRQVYFDRIHSEEKEIRNAKNSKIENILAMWRQKIEWYKTEFTYPENFKIEVDKKESGENAASPEMNESSNMMRSEESIVVEEQGFAAGARSESDMLMDSNDEMERKAKSDSGSDYKAIQISAWDPDTPYLNLIKKASKRDAYTVYLSQREEYGTAPSFYLDCGDFFLKQGEEELALQIWSNIREMELENPALLRILAHRLHQTEYLELSALIFAQVLVLRPEEPQSYRDLALVLAEMEEFEDAVDLFYTVVVEDWDRFHEIELIALVEMNNTITKAKRAGINNFDIDKRFIINLETDLRVILTWDADLTDMDLWITEPSGEKAYYGNRATIIGAAFSRDFTQGYGPEEYLLKKAMDGEYNIEVNYFSSGAPSLSGTVTLQVDVYTDYGKKSEKKQSITLRLTESTEVQKIGSVTIK